MTLNTRKPTGRPTNPVILVEGDEGAGKSFTAALLSASLKVNRTFWVQVGLELSADEYGSITHPRTGQPVRYEIVTHDGTWREIYGQIADARAQARKDLERDGRPDVLVLDTIGAMWDMCSEWAANRAMSSKSAKEKLAKDPNAEIDISANFWTEANGRWRRLMTQLLTFPGIVILLSRGRETLFMGDNGRPVAGKQDYRVEGQKGLTFDVPVWIRMQRDLGPRTARLVRLKSVTNQIDPPKRGERNPGRLVEDFDLETFVFDTLGYLPADSLHQQLVPMQAGNDAPLSDACSPLELGIEEAADEAGLRTAWAAMVAAHTEGRITDDERRQLTAMFTGRKATLDRLAAEAAARREPTAGVTHGPDDDPEGQEGGVRRLDPEPEPELDPELEEVPA